MKLVRSTFGYQAVTLPHASGDTGRELTIGRVPVLVADDHADKYARAAATVGVDLTVSDAPEGGPANDADDGGVLVGVPADLSRGVAAVTGTGDPVPQNTTTGDDADNTPEA